MGDEAMDLPVSALERIVGSDLTHVAVRPCGRIVELGFKAEGGVPIVLALPHQALGMLLMTLPRLIEMALHQRTGNASLRHVYPLGDWHVEATSDEASLLLSLATPDGFSVSFCLPADDARRLGQVLADHAPVPSRKPPVRH
jgi:hypothetical protein